MVTLDVFAKAFEIQLDRGFTIGVKNGFRAS